MQSKRKAQVRLVEKIKNEKENEKSLISSTDDRQKDIKIQVKKRSLRTPAAGVDGKGYKGAKGQDGPLQIIINHLPAHKTFVECCAGSGAISWNKKPAERTFLIEKDIEQFRILQKSFDGKANVVLGDAITIVLDEKWIEDDILFYWDVPYMFQTRSGQRRLYNQEWSDEDHLTFLDKITKDHNRHLISHPYCELYAKHLNSWNRVDFEYQTRKGLRWDAIWFNYPVPKELHEYTYIGKDHTDRQRINRKLNNLLRKISTLQVLEKNKFLELAKQYNFFQ